MKKTGKVMGPLQINNITAISDGEMAEIFNNHFTSVFTKENEQIIPNYQLPDIKIIQFPFENIYVSKEEILFVVLNLKNNKAQDLMIFIPVYLKQLQIA